MHTFRLLN